MSHANAVLSEGGRLRLARLVVVSGWPLARAAERCGVSVSTARRWAERFRIYGPAGMVDRSSRPRSSPRRTDRRLEHRVVGLRVARRWGPARIAYHLRAQRLSPSTVHKILVRYGCPPLTWTDPASGVRIRRARPRSYQHKAPGDLIHVDIKKLGKIPDGGGHRVLGRAAGQKNTRRGMIGYWYLHNAVDDRTRLAYSELLPDERQETAAAFWTRAHAWFTAAGITVRRVMTDNGACYRSGGFNTALGDIKHQYTRPYRPQTNGKVERFNRTALEEWAYARPYRSDTERLTSFADWLHTYNHHRGHTALNGKSPADLVPNLSGHNS